MTQDTNILPAPSPVEKASAPSTHPIPVRVRPRPPRAAPAPSAVTQGEKSIPAPTSDDAIDVSLLQSAQPEEDPDQLSSGSPASVGAKGPAKRGHSDYEVGYGKPPKATRFQPGQSGNPKGRGKGNPNAATLIEEALAQRITVRVDGKPKKTTRKQAIILMQSQLAMKGNIKAAQSLIPELAGGSPRPAALSTANGVPEEPKRSPLSATEKMMMACAQKDTLLADGFLDEDVDRILAMMGLLEFLPDDRRSQGNSDDAQ